MVSTNFGQFLHLGAKSWLNKWSTFWLKMLKVHVDHLLTQHICFKNVSLKLIFLINLILPAERRIFLKETKESEDHLLTQQSGKCGPLIDPTIYICCVYMYYFLFFVV